MSGQRTIGERLLLLKKHSGMSLAEIAEAAGYSGASSIQKLFRLDYNPKSLPKSAAIKLTRAFVGKGQPPLEAEEISSLAGNADAAELAAVAKAEFVRHARSSIVVLRTFRSWKEFSDLDGNATIVMELIRDQSGGHISRPPHLTGREIGGIVLSVGSMSPRYEIGETIFYDHFRPALVGDDVLIEFGSGDEQGALLIGRLDAITDEEIRLRQLQPDQAVRLSRIPGLEITKILRPTDLLPAMFGAG